MPLTFESGIYDNEPLLAICGEIVCQESTYIPRLVEPYATTSCFKLFLDLSKTTFVDSYGLGGLIYAQKLLDRVQKRLVLLDPHRAVMEVLRRNNLHRVFTIAFSGEEESAENSDGP